MRPRGLLASCLRRPWTASFGWRAGVSTRSRASSARPSQQDAEWRQIKYMIFELPERARHFRRTRAAHPAKSSRMTQWPQLIAVEQFRVADRAVLKRKLDEVVRGGGEGLMLHLADAAYVTGRSDVLLKVKPLQDTEAVVIEHVPGKGKYQGMLGALRVQMPDGKKFLIGTGFTDQRVNIRRRWARPSLILIAASVRPVCRGLRVIYECAKNSEIASLGLLLLIRFIFIPVFVQRPTFAAQTRGPMPLMAATGAAAAGNERVPAHAAAVGEKFRIITRRAKPVVRWFRMPFA